MVDRTLVSISNVNAHDIAFAAQSRDNVKVAPHLKPTTFADLMSHGCVYQAFFKLQCSRWLRVFLLTAISTMSLPTVATPYLLDRFWGERNGSALFNDDFNDGSAPPVGSTYIGSTNALYSSSSDNFVGAERGGKLTLDPVLNGRQTVNRFTLQPEGIYFMAANLNVDVNPANSTLGFKLNHTYAIHALYDLRRQASDFGNNGIRLADYDNLGPQGYNDIIDLEVGRSTVDGSLRLFFIRRDLRLQTRLLISSTFLNDVLGDQIELSLLKETANDPTITGAFRYFRDGVAQSALIRVGETDGYNGEVFTRPAVFAFEAIPLPGTLGLGIFGFAGMFALDRRRIKRKNLNN
jgi:hypothetical protein